MAGTDHDYAECHRSGIMARAARRAKRMTSAADTPRPGRCSAPLLTDTELAEDRVEHVLGADFSRDRAERLGGRRDIDRDDLRRHSLKRASAASLEGFQSQRERLAMALARDRRAVIRPLMSERLDRSLKLVTYHGRALR